MEDLVANHLCNEVIAFKCRRLIASRRILLNLMIAPDDDVLAAVTPMWPYYSKFLRRSCWRPSCALASVIKKKFGGADHLISDTHKLAAFARNCSDNSDHIDVLLHLCDRLTDDICLLVYQFIGDATSYN